MSIAIIPQNPAPNHRWKQRIFKSKHYPHTLLVLHDHSVGLYVPGSTYDALQVADQEFKELVVSGDDDGSDPIHAIVHAENRKMFTGDFFSPLTERGAPDSRKRIVLQVSRTSSVASLSESEESVVWLSMKDRAAYQRIAEWLPEFLKLDFETAAKIADSAKHGIRTKVAGYEENYAHLLDVILPKRVENLLALRLLCESWLLIHWNQGSSFPRRNDLSNALGISVDDYRLPAGVRLNSPESLDDWFRPFGENHDGDRIASITEGLRAEDTKSSVLSFFKSFKTRSELDFSSVAELYLSLYTVAPASS